MSEVATQPDSAESSRNGKSRRWGNRNALLHGLCLPLGKLPKGASYIQRLVYGFRRELRAAVVEQRGEVTLIDVAAIDAACKWERHSQLCLRWLRESPDLTPEQKLSFSKEVATSADRRNAAIKTLDLKRPDDQDPWPTFDVESEPTDGDGSTHTEPTSDATAASTGNGATPDGQ